MKTIASDPTTVALIGHARHASAAAYAPYSGFRVGAAVLTADGEIYGGCNVENASYGLTVCAERVAIWKAVSDGAPRITTLVVYTPTSTITAPCGACRQVAFEFGPDMKVICVCDGGEEEFTLAQLLPGAFGPSSLGK
jgi:cytidine deaminase